MRLSECYALLEVSPGADLERIKAAYRKLAFKYHPDLNTNDPKAQERFTRINEAYVLLKKHMESKTGAGRKHYDAETIFQEEEAKVQSGSRKAGTFYAKQEEVLKDILNDPFAKQVFEDIFSKLKKGKNPTTQQETTQSGSKTVSMRLGEKKWNLDITGGFASGIKKWFSAQLDDHQTIYMPPRNLIPGSKIRVEIKHRLSGEPQLLEIVIPHDYVLGRPIRLKGQGRKLGPWRGDLFLRLLAK